MILIRKEWKWVHSRLVKLTQPTIELQTLASRLEKALGERVDEERFFLAITESQSRWIESRCRLITWHSRPAQREARGVGELVDEAHRVHRP